MNKLIKQRLREEDEKEVGLQITTTNDDLDKVMHKATDATKRAGSNAVPVGITLVDETEVATTSPVSKTNEDSDYYVEYIKDMQGEEPFVAHGGKYQFVWCKYPDGKRDIGVYIFGSDLCMSYPAFRRSVLGLNEAIGGGVGVAGDKNTQNSSVGLTGDDYESVSRGAEQGEVGGSDWEELIDLLQPKAPIKEVKGRLTKTKLEEHIKKVNKPNVLKVVKIKDILK